jgi:hypothetical protein
MAAEIRIAVGQTTASSLLDGSLPCDARASACMALPYWVRVRFTSL